MTREEATEWIKGNRSTVNQVPSHPLETWIARTAEADAAMTQQAYWTLKAWSENLVK